MTTVSIDGRQLKLSNLDKVLYPATGFTKGEVIDYYARIAAAAVPHYAGRPMTLKRYPNGVDDKFFFEKNCPSHRPGWVTTAPTWSGHSRRTIEFCVVDSVATLVWTANLAALELHPSLSRAGRLDQPTMVVFDLDPGPPAGIAECCEVACHLRDLFGHLDLQAFPKTSGSKGMQVYVPLNCPVTYDQPGGTQPFALAVAQMLERRHPGLVVSNMAKDLRTGKVLVDWSQNDESKTTIGVYSLRAREAPTVSTPLRWDEVERADPAALRFTAGDVLERVEAHGDLFAPTLELRQSLPRLG
ncbi:MAG TPA: non-homologous end-joining DNA ligase [Acidimicrobiales bacterium]|nr:non-homologous end-joining DNA ligase [Acidimicrobiales bacterium]